MWKILECACAKLVQVCLDWTPVATLDIPKNTLSMVASGH